MKYTNHKRKPYGKFFTSPFPLHTHTRALLLLPCSFLFSRIGVAHEINENWLNVARWWTANCSPISCAQTVNQKPFIYRFLRYYLITRRAQTLLYMRPNEFFLFCALWIRQILKSQQDALTIELNGQKMKHILSFNRLNLQRFSYAKLFGVYREQWYLQKHIRSYWKNSLNYSQNKKSINWISSVENKKNAYK